MFDLNLYDLYLLDMDGTIYFENHLIDGAKDFINKLVNLNKHYVFVSNNSAVSKSIYLDKLHNLGIKCNDENIFSASMATGLYLQENYPNSKVYPVGTLAFSDELRNYGVNLVQEDADIVVVSYDRELTYQKLIDACYFIDKGALFLAANPDLVYPLKDHKYVPDCGSMCIMITNATKKEPTYIGKPNSFIVDVLSEKFKIAKEKMIIIGDRLYTDIMLGVNASIASTLVLTGETTKSMLDEAKVAPTYVVDSIKDLIGEK